MEQVLTFPTHSLTLTEINGFVKATNLVSLSVLKTMQDSIFSERKKMLNFVLEERKLLHNFVKSLVDFHNKEEDILLGIPPMQIFSDEAEYYVFCLVNDVPFYEQEWFKVIYIKSSFLYSITLFQSMSASFIKVLYPEEYNPPVDLLREEFQRWQANQSLYKCSKEQYVDFLKQNSIDVLYHFTNRNNLNSIKINGICSVSELNRLGIKNLYSSTRFSRQIDESKKLSDYVHLSYEHKHPMLFVALAEGRLYDYVILNVSTEVIFLKDTKFSDFNVARSDATIRSEIEFFLKLPFKIFHKKDYFSLSEIGKKYFQAEVLVKTKINNQLILNINKL